jgi:hypothetical protein
MRRTTPASLTNRLAPPARAEVTRWWHRLTTAERRTLGRDAGRPPRGVVGRFVEAGEREDAPGGVTDFYEYLVNHEIFLEDGRPYHICSAHPEARAAVNAGHVPATFHCPRGIAECPMRRLLDVAPGHDLRLVQIGRCA